jgi:hypothetical protein
VEERVCAGTHADRAKAVDAELVEHRKDVARAVGESKLAARIGRAAVAAKVGSDLAISGERLGEDVLPIVARSGEAVQQQ